MARVWEHSRHKGSALLLMLAIADHAHDDGTGAWPSVPTLAKKIRMSPRQVTRLLKILSSGPNPELGVVERQGTSSMFTVRVDAGDRLSPPESARRVTAPLTQLRQAPRDTAVSGGGDTAVSPKPSPTVLDPSAKSSAGDGDDGDQNAISDALELLRELDGYIFEGTADYAMLRRVQRRRPQVPLVDEIEGWSQRGRDGVQHSERSALEGWLLKAHDGPPRKRDPRCVTPGCRGRGRGASRLCVLHLGLAIESSSSRMAVTP